MNIIDPVWEIAAFTGTVILAVKVSPQLANVPRPVKWTHWGLVGIYSLLGINGIPIILMFCMKHENFNEAFSQSNVLGVKPFVMQWLAMGFGILATILFIVSMELGNLRAWARSIFGYLVLPCSLLYPVVWVTATGVFDQSVSAVIFTRFAILGLSVLSCLSIIFYRTRLVTERINFS